MEPGNDTHRQDTATELGPVVQRIVVAGFEAMIRRRPDRQPTDHDAYSVQIGPTAPAGAGTLVVSRNDLPVIEQLARRALLVVCHAQGESVLVERPNPLDELRPPG